MTKPSYKKKAKTHPATVKEAGTAFDTAAQEEVAAAADPEAEEASPEFEVPVASAAPDFDEEPVLVPVAELDDAVVVLVSCSTPGHSKIQARIVLEASEPGIMSLGKPL